MNNVYEPDGIEKSVGAFGRWQFAMCVILYIVKIPIAYHQLIVVLISPPTEDFTCASNPDNKCDPACTKHVFNTSIFSNTIIMTWDLVCERSYIPSLVQSLIMFGILSSNFLCGFLADRFGRKYLLISSILVLAVAGSAAAYVPWLWCFMVLKFFSGMAVGTLTITSFILIMEVVGLKWRTIVTSLQHILFSMGHLLLAPIGYYVRDWQHSQLLCSAPIAILLIFAWAIPESPRWEISVGRREKAISTLTKGAKFNRLPTEDIVKNVDEYIAKNDIKFKKGGNITDIFKTKRLTAKVFVVVIEWFHCGFIYFGISQFSGTLRGEIFANIAIAAACTIPGMIVAVITVQTIGRKPSLVMANVFSLTGTLLLIPFQHHPYANSASVMITLFGCSIGFSSVYTYAGELFPTIIRNFATGIASFIARLGTVIVPHLMHLNNTDYEKFIPVVFASLSFISLLASLWLPETKDCKLPDTVEDSEKYKLTIKFTKPEQYDFDLF